MTREQKLEDLLRRVLEENDHNVSTEGLISTLTWDLAAEIAVVLEIGTLPDLPDQPAGTIE